MAQRKKKRKIRRIPPYHFDGAHCRDSQGAFVPVAQCRRRKKPGGGQLGHVTWDEGKKFEQELRANMRKIKAIKKKKDATKADVAKWRKFEYMNEGIIKMASKLGMDCHCWEYGDCACRRTRGQWEWQK